LYHDVLSVCETCETLSVLLGDKKTDTRRPDCVERPLNICNDPRRQAQRWLVQDKHAWPAQQRASDGDHLLFASAQSPAALTELVGQCGEELQYLLDAASRPGVRPRAGRDDEVLGNGQLGKDAPALEEHDHARRRNLPRRHGKRGIVEDDLSAFALTEPGDAPAEGRLAGAIGSADQHEFAGRYGQRCVLHRCLAHRSAAEFSDVKHRY
jgi:hypothetical protein